MSQGCTDFTSSCNIHFKIMGLELTIKRSYQTCSHNLHFKMTGLFRRFLKRRNMSSSRIHSCYIIIQFSSASQSCPTLWDPMNHSMTGFPVPSPTLRACSNSCLFNRWCHSTISSSVVPFSSCLQSFPASGSFQMSQFFASGGQSIWVAASASVLPENTQDWSPLGWTGWISSHSKGLSRVFSNTTLQKHHVITCNH